MDGRVGRLRADRIPGGRCWRGTSRRNATSPLDEGRWENAALPCDNLASALIALEKNRDPERAPALLKTLRG